MRELSHIASALVIEDDYLIAVDLATMLKGLGLKSIKLVANCEGAVELLESEHFDFATVDLRLPNEICFTAIDALIAARTPFIYVTGHDRSKDEAVPAAPWVSKPASREDLLTGILSAVSCSRTPTLKAWSAGRWQV